MNKQLEKRKELQEFVDTLLIFFENAPSIEEVDMDKVNSSIKKLNEIKDVLSDPTSCLTFSEKIKFSQDFEEKLLRDDIEEYLKGYTEQQFRDLFGYQKSFAEKNIQDIVEKYKEERFSLEDESNIFYESVRYLRNKL